VTRRFLVAAEARSDIAEAVGWLRDRSPELPPRFRIAVDETFAAIADRAEMFPVVHREIRRALLRHFPYSVFYFVQDELILVLGVVHQARHPSVWQRRPPN
jgi:toxin ParE1/3/4